MKPDGSLVRSEPQDQIVHIFVLTASSSDSRDQGPRRKHHQFIELGQAHCSISISREERLRHSKAFYYLERPRPGSSLLAEPVFISHRAISDLECIGYVVRQNTVLLLIETDNEMGALDSLKELVTPRVCSTKRAKAFFFSSISRQLIG